MNPVVRPHRWISTTNAVIASLPSSVGEAKYSAVVFEFHPGFSDKMRRWRKGSPVLAWSHCCHTAVDDGPKVNRQLRTSTVFAPLIVVHPQGESK
jgi:hypothetical protein